MHHLFDAHCSFDAIFIHPARQMSWIQPTQPLILHHMVEEVKLWPATKQALIAIQGLSRHPNVELEHQLSNHRTVSVLLHGQEHRSTDQQRRPRICQPHELQGMTLEEKISKICKTGNETKKQSLRSNTKIQSFTLNVHIQGSVEASASLQLRLCSSSLSQARTIRVPEPLHFSSGYLSS